MAENDYSNRINFYPGTDYGFDVNYGKDWTTGIEEGDVRAATISMPSDPRTANQLTAVSQRLNTGAKAIEAGAISAEVMESIPKQLFKEIDRLKKLTGAELTFHGPLIEASGWSEQGWSETNRQGAEMQIWNAVEKAHDLEPSGNVIVTLHSTAGLPELRTKVKTPEGEKVTELIVYDEHTGEARRIKPSKSYLIGEYGSVEEELEKTNKESWGRELSNLAFHARQGQGGVEDSLGKIGKVVEEVDEKAILGLYGKAKTEKGQKILEDMDPHARQVAQRLFDEIHYGEVYLKESYFELQRQFDKAWAAAKKTENDEDLEKLQSYKKYLKEVLAQGENYFDKPQNLVEFGNTIQKGVNVLNSLNNVPQSLMPMENFIIDKSSDTYSQLALNSYKKFEDSAPIISIENPPAGGALSRSSELKKLVEESRKKFVNKAVKELGMSEGEAKEQAEKLIGVTWDVGHINMLRKFGYKKEELAKESEKIAPYVKHIHLSDNFGFEHTELPMGMGNVPMKEHLEALKKYNKQIEKIKKVSETGQWFQHFKTMPLPETLRAFGSPIYSMAMAPYWNRTLGFGEGYWAGGIIYPEQHFSMYGSGFANLPPELGGQLGGKARMGGAPIE